MIELHDVHLAYGPSDALDGRVELPSSGSNGVAVLNGVSCVINPGEIVAVIGANGSGKSTLGRIMCASQIPQRGSATVDAHDAASSEAERLAVRRLVGYVQQDPFDQIVSSVMFDEIAFGPRNIGCEGEELARCVQEVAAQASLIVDDAVSTSELSGGQQQRLALAGVLAMHPSYLVLDEIAAQLDSSLRPHMRRLFRALAHLHGIGIALITHDPLEVFSADRVMVMSGGSIVWEGTASGFLEDGACWHGLLPESSYLDAVRSAVGAGFELRGGVEPEDLAAWRKSHRSASAQTAAFDSIVFNTAAERPTACCGGVPSPSGAPAPARLDMRGVCFSYGEREVLHGVDVQVGAGSILLLAGRSGSGKSTCAHIAAGLADPSAGSVTIDGKPAAPQRCSLSFQRPESQFFLDSVYDELAFAPRSFGLSPKDVDERVRAAAGLVGLDASLLERYPFELSGGQARRVAVASVLTMDAPVCILDEPSAGLDAEGRRFAHRLVHELASRGKGVMVISHDVDEWLAVADEVALMGSGSIAWHGPVADIGSPSALRAFVRCGLAPPNMELLRALLADADCAEASEGLRPATRALDASGRCREADTGAGTEVPCRGAAGTGAAATPLSRLDARVKVFLLLAVTAGVFLAFEPWAIAIWVLLLAVCMRASRIGASRILHAMRPVAIVLAITLCANLIACDGGAPVTLAGPVGIDPAGGARGVAAIVRILILVGFSCTVALSTTASQLGEACVRLLRPLSRLRVPVAQLGTALSLALRFIPIVSEELARIRLAQRARGANFEEGGLVQRIRIWMSVLSPLIVGLFRRADRLGASMAARCYAGAALRRLPEPCSLGWRDKAVLACGAAVIFAVIAVAALC